MNHYTRVMAFIETKHTFALIKRIESDLNKIGYILTIVMQVCLFLYYSFAIYSHWGNWIYISLYFCLLVISILVFIEAILYERRYRRKEHKEVKEKHKKLNRIFKIVGIVNKLALLVLSLIPIIQGKASDFDKVITVALAILILVQVAYLFFTYLLNKYLSLLLVAVQLDLNESAAAKIKKQLSLKEHIHNWAGKFEEQPSDQMKDSFEEEFQDELSEVMQNKEVKAQEKKEKKALEKSELNRRFHHDLDTLKNHFQEKKIDKKLSDKKLDAFVKKYDAKARNLLEDEKKYNALLFDCEEEIKKKPLKEELDYIEYFLSLMEENKEDLSLTERKAILVNLLYFLSPIVPNDENTKDNLLVLEKTFGDLKEILQNMKD